MTLRTNPTLTADLIDEAVRQLEQRPEWDPITRQALRNIARDLRLSHPRVTVRV